MNSLQVQENGDNKILVESVVFIKRGVFFYFLIFLMKKKFYEIF